MDLGFDLMHKAFDSMDIDGKRKSHNQIHHYHHHHLFFDQSYRCFPLSDHFDCGNKIIMPASTLNRLAAMEIEFPMVFQIQNPNSGRLSHCGVLEFSANEGFVFLPTWMMKNMQLREGEIVNLKNVSVPKGNYLRLQPHTMNFLTLSDHKILLEKTLREFSCVTKGDTVMITHMDQKYYVDVVETKPFHAISLFEVDCQIDFALPLDYKEPEKRLVKPVMECYRPEKVVEEVREFIPFTAFTGVARRLDGQQPLIESQALRPMKKSKLEEKIKERKFEPFTGKKYTLAG